MPKTVDQWPEYQIQRGFLYLHSYHSYIERCLDGIQFYSNAGNLLLRILYNIDWPTQIMLPFNLF